MYSPHNEETSVVVKDLLGLLVSKNVKVHKVDDKVDKYTNTYHRAIKMMSTNVKKVHILILKSEIMIKIQNLKVIVV